VPNAIRVNFQVGGVDSIDRAFRSVQQAADRFESRTRKAYDNEARAAQKAEREKARERDRGAREEVRLRESTYRTNAKISTEEVKAEKKKADEKLKIEERWARVSLDYAHRLSMQKQRLIEEEVRAFETAQRKKQAAQERFSRAIGKRVGSGLGGLAHGAVGMAGMALSLGGGLGVADAVQSGFAAERAAAQLVNAVTSSGKAPAGANVNSILSQAGGIAINSGMSKAEVVSGALAYARSARGGDFNGAMGNMDFFAKMSKATGANIEELAGAAGILQSQNADLGKDPALMRQMLLNAYAQTKSGSVSLPDAAKQFGTLGSTRGFYQGNEANNQMTLLGLGQIAAAGGSAEEIGTFIKDVSTEAAQHRHAKGNFVGLENMGVKFDKVGRMESPEQMIGAVMKATGGDLGQIGEIFGKRGLPLFSELQKSYLGAGGGDKGVAAVQAQIHGVTQSTMTTQDLESQFAQVMETPAERTAKAFERVKEAAEERLTPFMLKMADALEKNEPQIERFMDDIASAVDWLTQHPFEGLGIIIAGSITKDIAAAAIGEGVRAAFDKAIAAAGSKGINLGGALSIAAAGAVAIAAEQAWINQSISDDHAHATKNALGQADAATMVAKLQHDPSKQNVAAAQALMTQIQASEGTIGQKSSFGQFASWFQSGEDSKKEEAENRKLFRSLADSVDKLKSAIDRANANGPGGKPPNDPSRNNPINNRTGPPGAQ
jgi:hypothetical protein